MMLTDLPGLRAAESASWHFLPGMGKINLAIRRNFRRRERLLSPCRCLVVAGIDPAQLSAMKLMQNPDNRICALSHAACSIKGQAKSPILSLPLRAGPLA